MTDRELLELAAKAAGIPIHFSDDGSCYHAEMGGNASFRYRNPWNPLTDDGDALRLAVKLEMNIGNRAGQFIEAWAVSEHDGGICRGVVPKGDDACAETRRAIVRAAAEIGRAMP